LSILKKPEHTTLNLAENAHPAVKNERSNFIVIVKTAKDKADFRQSQLFTGKEFFCNETLCIVDLIAVREIDNFFGVAILAAFRYQCSISNEIVNIPGTHGTRETKITDLNRCCPQGKYAGTRVLRKALQVNCNINLELP